MQFMNLATSKRHLVMNQAELIEAAGGYKVDPEKIISGGPMMGFSYVYSGCSGNKDFFIHSLLHKG